MSYMTFFTLKKFIYKKTGIIIFVCWSKYLIINNYVGNLLIIKEIKNEINLLKKVLITCFKIKNLGLSIHYFEFQIISNFNASTIILTQETYVLKILDCFKI